MDSQNMAYTADNGGGYDQSYDPNVDSNVAGSENYPLEDQNQYDSGYAQPPLPATHSATAGSLFRSEEMALCQLFLQVCPNQILLISFWRDIWPLATLQYSPCQGIKQRKVRSR